jgi:ribosomal-protein-alanine N-acetyltransferase
MTADDLTQVMDLQRAAFRNPWSSELFRRELDHHWSTIYLAEETQADGNESTLLGFVIFWLVHDELHILNVATAPEQRRRGVGRALMMAAMERGRQHGCALATLEVRKTNQAAIELYRSLGFRSVGIRPNYYVEEGEDAVVMLLRL